MGLSYGARLGRLVLFSLEHKRLRGVLIELYKITSGMDKVNTHNHFPTVKDSVTGGHRLKVGDLRGNSGATVSLRG